MSEPNETEQLMTEKQLLMRRCDQLGITYSNASTEETLKKKIDERLSEGTKGSPEIEETNALDAGAEIARNADSIPVAVKPTKKTLRSQMYAENMRLIRCRIQNLDPKKANLPGEIITVANEYLGTVRHFVPYGEVTDDGWHIPYIIYKLLARRTFLNITVTKDRRTRQDVVKQNYVREFALEVLPPLTEVELARLATAQVAAGSIDMQTTI